MPQPSYFWETEWVGLDYDQIKDLLPLQRIEPLSLGCLARNQVTITTELSRSEVQKFSCNLLLGFPIVLSVLPAT